MSDARLQPHEKSIVINLDRYILRQFFGPFVLIIIVLTMVIWMTQSLQRVDILIENGSGFGLFFYISVLVIPSLLVVLIPFALYGAAIYTLYRLHSDSEVAVMFAAGVSRVRIALPILIVTFFGALATLYVALDLSPRTYRTLKKNVQTIRTDLAGSVLRSGEFVTAIDGYTIYVEKVLARNEFEGMLIHDYSNRKESRTFMAQRGAIRETDAGPVLILVNGNMQRSYSEKPDIEILPFSETRRSIASFQSKDELQLELTERYLPELLHPDLTREWERQNQGKLLAEAHNRLATPFHAFCYVMVALYALIGGAYNRRGYMVRIITATGFVVALRVSGFLVQSYSSETGTQWIQYALPIGVTLVSLALLFDLPQLIRRWRQQPRGIIEGVQA